MTVCNSPDRPSLNGESDLRPRLARNRILASFAVDDARAIEGHFRVVAVDAGTTLMEQDEVIGQLIFPLTAAVSLLTVLDSGKVHEHVMVGHDGMVGFASLLGEPRMPFRALVQVPGEVALLRPSDVPPEAIPALRDAAARYAVMMLRLAGQAAACASAHLVEERVARALLRLEDLTGRSDIPITHEFIALLLGVQRQTVTLAAGKLQRDGLIRYGRGHIAIVDRDGLAAASCECYRVMRRALEHLFD